MTFELKCNFAGQSYEDAIYQYRTARDPKTRLFLFKSGALVNFAMDLEEVYMATKLDKDATFFLPFNMGNGVGIDTGAGNPIFEDKFSVSYMWEDILTKDSILELISKFMFIETKEKINESTGKKKVKETLIFPRYHQRDVVHKLLEDVQLNHTSQNYLIQHSAVNESTGKKKVKETLIFPRYHQRDVVHKLLEDVQLNHTSQNYLIQHSAGSGKTNSIAWLAHRLSSLHDIDNEVIFDNIIIVTDGVVVDRQLQTAIMGMEHKSGLIKVMDDKCNSADLANALTGNTKIIATTIQKFPYIVDQVAQLNQKKFAVIIDEAHSSTAGKDMAAVTKTLGSGYVDDDSSTEDLIAHELSKNGKQSNVSVFAFTATPKPTTLQLFGRVNAHGQMSAFHVYSMKQAIEEGFILDVLQNYITYKTYYQINKEIEEDPKYQTNKAKRQIARFIELHETNIMQRIEIIVEHFRTTVKDELGGTAKAMIITPSREAAVKYRQELENYIIKKGYDDIQALVAFSGKVNLDDEEYTEAGMNGFPEVQLTQKFDKPNYNVLLVANKYQTGFDQPKLCAMYILKKLKGVNAVQTLSRLNRICPPFEKKTFVLDFVNSYADIEGAFAMYILKKLKGVNAVQTLSRLNRICPPFEKKTFVLDFVNSYADIEGAFSQYYTTTLLSNSVTPNSIYDLEAKIDGYFILDPSDIDAANDLIYMDKLAAKDKRRLTTLLGRAKRNVEKEDELGYFILDPSDIDAANDLIYMDKLAAKDKRRLTTLLGRAKRNVEKEDELTQREIVSTMRKFVRFYEFLIQATCFEDTELHKKYNFILLLLSYINIKNSGGGFDLTGKITAINFVQKKKEEHVKPKHKADPVVKLPSAENFVLTEDKVEKLSEIINEINSIAGKEYDNDVAVKAMLQIKDIMMKSDKLKTSAKNNTEKDFEFAYYDNIDDALIEGLEQNQDFFGLLLCNEDIKKRVLGIFADEVYKSLKLS